MSLSIPLTSACANIAPATKSLASTFNVADPTVELQVQVLWTTDVSLCQTPSDNTETRHV